MNALDLANGCAVPPGELAGASAHLEMSAQVLARELEEVIAALDRRVPRVERAGELAIARDAAALRAKAVARLATIIGTSCVHAEGKGEPL